MNNTTAALLVVEALRLRLDLADGAPDPEPVRAALAVVTERMAGPEGQTRSRLVSLFGLAPAEADLLDCAVAVAVEPALGPRLARLQGLPQALLPTVVALRLLYGHGAAPLPRSASPLLQWSLVQVHALQRGEPPQFEADPAIVEWYHGLPSLGEVKGPGGVLMNKLPAPDALPEWHLQATVQRVRQAAARVPVLRVLVPGPSGSGRASLAAALVQALGQRALAVRPAGSDTSAADVARVQRLVLLMGGVVPVWRGSPPHWPVAAMMAPLQCVTIGEDESIEPLDGVVDLLLPLPPLAPASRDRLAAQWLPPAVTAALSPLGSPRLSDLRSAAGQGVDTAAAFQAYMRQRTVERVRGVGRIVTPRFEWADLVLPQATRDLLQALESEARAREALLADPERRRLFEGTAALTALFAGPPGAGKSMAAQVVAAALKLELLIVDTSAISSKYIGETAKKLSAAFTVARESNCALLFEEADGLFARRVEADSVNARYANADTGHLLQLVENHRQLVMLSTNRRADIDPAFLRRLRFIIEFPLPGEAERAQLWSRLLQVLGVDAERAAALAAPAAAAHPLSAAQIKSAALSAAFMAGGGAGITAELMLAGIRRELAKDGRVGEIVTPLAGSRRAHG